MKWNELSIYVQSAIIAWKIMGWQWVLFDFEDCSLSGQLWLLPSPQATRDLTSGEWTWYREEEEISPEGSAFPLPHQDKRLLPTWLFPYSYSLSLAWKVAQQCFDEIEMHYHAGMYICTGWHGPEQLRVIRTSQREALLLLALRQRGLIDAQDTLLIEVF